MAAGALGALISANRRCTIMQPSWCPLTRQHHAHDTYAKNILDDVYVRLKASADSHRRSLNSEAIVCLEAILLPGKATADEVISRARALRESLPKGRFTAKGIEYTVAFSAPDT